ncbi:uncharacterized protein LOC110862910 isoform X2 [Folsomia candida]|uniref:uncharacterized protein LOC110862910 isoform X2 n=1 Tax=Folsomia candida TaxID=158441 RepID=UPI001605173C|nr:uncharacterized protein LOC110862910 isoform X2 [Folsomia candida]
MNKNLLILLVLVLSDLSCPTFVKPGPFLDSTLAKDVSNDVSIMPGELLNETCYVSGNPSGASVLGVRAFKEYEVLLKTEDEVYEWTDFDGKEGTVANGAIIGGIGSHYEPILVCRKFLNGTGHDIGKSKAVLGQFSPEKGVCFYEVEVNLSDWIKWDVSLATEKFQLLILRARGKEQCAVENKT